MLFTRNALFFREYFKTVIARDRDRDLDLNFIAPMHPDKKRFEKGFAKLVYANRDDVGKFLRTTALNVAADQQAIYELIQNADDCNSSFFSVSYNEKYLLCINNGNYFTESNMSAIINVGASDKEGEDIGTFGIGFKILHRLVGKDDGLEAIVDEYAGPTIFSWNKFFQLEKFINGEDLKVGYDKEKDKENAWLVKILYTCFPTSLGEKIRLRDYETQAVKFDEIELTEMRDFLKISLQNVNLQETNNLKSGSIFFLKLGEGKYRFIEDGIENLKSGISYSFNFLNSLKKIYINGEEITKQNVQSYSKEYKLDSAEFTEISPRNTQRNIKFSFAFCVDYQKSENIANTKTEKYLPNFYNFFSMDEEKNGFRFLVHCNSFDMNNDRRKLQPNSQINEKLLPIIARDIIEYIDTQKDKNRNLFLNLYASLLLSKEPKNKPNINDFFFIHLKNYLPTQIPTQKNYTSNAKNVKTKNTLLDISPSDFGCPEIEWFYWHLKADENLINEARSSEKLDLEKWDIIDLIKYAVCQGKIEDINNWIKNANEAYFADNKNFTYINFIKEIDKKITERDFQNISQIKLFKFSDNNYYSLNEIFANPNLIITYEKTTEIRAELRHIGLLVSNLDVSKNPNFAKLIIEKLDEEILFKAIAEKCVTNTLRNEQKQKLFFTLVNFDRISVEKLKDLEIFKDIKGQIRPLRNMLKGTLQVPNWLSSFKINLSEYDTRLDKYLVSDKDIYKSIIFKNWDYIIEQNPDAKNLYERVTFYYQQNNDENQRLEKLACIYTNEGFKRSDQVFFNSHLNSINFYNLQNAIFKVSEKPTPQKLIFSFLINENSPFKISKTDDICSFINESVSLSYSETSALLEFAKANNEEIFKFAYIQKQNDDFLLIKHFQSTFQYFSNRNEINELLTDNSIFKLLPKEFNANNLRNLGILQDKELNLNILQTLDFSENLISIIKECDKEVQLSYLSKIKYLSLQEGKTYDKNSFEHNCLKLAIRCYETTFLTEFAPKILINESLRIKDIAVKDDINFTIDNKEYKLSLSTVLPNYKGISDIITKVINQFLDFSKTELSENVFPISNKNKNEILLELQTDFKVLKSIEQFAFLLFYSKLTNKNYFTTELISNLPNTDILNFCYEKKFTEINTYINLDIQNKVYPSEFALESEKLPSWVLTWLETSDQQEKLNYLALLDVFTENSNVVLLRKFFKTIQETKIQPEVSNFPQNSIFLINTLKWLQNFSIKNSEPLKLEKLQQIYSRINFATDIPLLNTQRVEVNETTYVLEVSNAITYYFENQNNEFENKILVLLKNKGFKLIALEYFKSWQANINPIKIDLKKQLDNVTLENNSQEWEDKAYQQWKNAQTQQVFIYKGDKLPYKTTFLEQEIYVETEGFKIKEGNKIYICQSQSHDIINQLKEYVSADELIKLYQIDIHKVSISKEDKQILDMVKEFGSDKIINLLSKLGGRNIDDVISVGIQAFSNEGAKVNTGYEGEKIVLMDLISKYGQERVKWTSAENPENINGTNEYDFEVYDKSLASILLYVDAKSTTSKKYQTDKTEIYWRNSEWKFIENEISDNYLIARVFDVNGTSPEIVYLKVNRQDIFQ